MNAAQRRISQINLGGRVLNESISTKSKQYISQQAREVAEQVTSMQRDDILITVDFLHGLLRGFAERCVSTITADFERGINGQ